MMMMMRRKRRVQALGLGGALRDPDTDPVPDQTQTHTSFARLTGTMSGCVENEREYWVLYTVCTGTTREEAKEARLGGLVAQWPACVQRECN
jgi:hypothetical protein